MLRLPSFDYAAPRTLADAARMLAEAGTQAAVMSGGTDLLPHMKRRQHLPRLVIGLRNIPDLRGISRRPDGGVRVGAGATLDEVARHALIRANYPALSDAVRTIASPAIRYMGTLGGNLCIETRCRCYDLPALTRDALGHCFKDGGRRCTIAPGSPRCWAIVSSDAAPILVAMDARVRLVASWGERLIPLRQLYRDDGLRPLALEPGEILTDILLPPTDGMRAAYHKMRARGAIDFAALGVAVMVRELSDGVVSDATIVLGALASAPLLATEASKALVGRRLDGTAIRDAAEAAGRITRPLENADGSASWRKRMVAVATTRALQAIASG